MTPRLILTFALLASTSLLSACAQLAIGAGAAVIADEVVEDQRGGDGLF